LGAFIKKIYHAVVFLPHYSCDQIKKNEMFGACSMYGGEESFVRGFGWGNRVGEGPIGRPMYGWEDNIKIDVQEVGRCGIDWIGMAQDRDR
jgi:hypothetical protein